MKNCKHIDHWVCHRNLIHQRHFYNLFRRHRFVFMIYLLEYYVCKMCSFNIAHCIKRSMHNSFNLRLNLCCIKCPVYIVLIADARSICTRLIPFIPFFLIMRSRLLLMRFPFVFAPARFILWLSFQFIR